MNPTKLALARLLERTGIHRALLWLQASVAVPHVRIVNYHDVPPSSAEAFEQQLRYYAEHFSPVGYPELLDFESGRWRPERPGLVLSFDDGLRSHSEVAAPLLEKYGFPGWFLVPVGFVDAAPRDQADFAEEHRIQVAAAADPGERLALSWEEVRSLDGRHVIGCHTLTHRRLGPSLPAPQLDAEIRGAKRALEERLGHPVDVFAWVGGEDWSYSAEAARVVREAGFRVAFMTNSALVRPGADLLQLQRSNVEADFPPELVRFQISGVQDLAYAAKRRRVLRRTAATEPGAGQAGPG